ncbi:hypothetical protein Trydic_g2731 [Trypoxylus dichotomus]
MQCMYLELEITSSKNIQQEVRAQDLYSHAVETRANTTKMKSMIRTEGMKTLQVIKGVGLKEDLEIQDVIRSTRARRRFWMDHVDRMTEDRCAKWANSRRPPKSHCFPRE